MTIEKKLLGTNPVSGEVLPEAVSFDGTNDNLIKSSDLTNNINSKTFTFSAWFYVTAEDSGRNMYLYDSYYNSGMYVQFDNNRKVQCLGVAQGGTGNGYLSIESPINVFVAETWQHIIISVDMANTSNRHVYINDQSISVTWNSYSNAEIGFAQTVHAIGTNSPTGGAGTRSKSRLANMFLDYTYRDLSVVANRRLFRDADGKPSSTIPSNPILYLPMKDAATAGSNSGTGGNFAAVGLLATAERGPNQDNCSASVFDGTNDYLSISGIGAVSSKTITFNVNWYQNAHKSSEPHILMGFSTNGTTIQISGNKLIGSFRSSNGSDVVNFEMNNAMYTYPVFKIHESISMCIDVDDVNKCKMFINGQVVAATFSIVNAVNIVIPNGTIQIGRDTLVTNDLVAANLGELYFDDGYIDLATDNPFWDSDTNRPNSVRKVIADTSVTPLIALPMIGNDAGNNLGSGGDFTVNSGPFTGARGGSEFWVSSLVGVAPDNYVSLNATQAVLPYTDGKQFTIFGMMRQVTSDNNKDFQIEDRVNLFNYFGSANNPNSRITLVNSSGAEIYKREWAANTLGLGAWYLLMFSVDLTDSAKDIYMYNQVDAPSATVFTNNEIGTSSALSTIIAPTSAASRAFAGYYITDSYTDFKQESVRNKFVDQLGYPRDLTQQIEDGDIATPIIYMKFDDLSAIGTNSGSGANFTVTGTGRNGPNYTP